MEFLKMTSKSYCGRRTSRKKVSRLKETKHLLCESVFRLNFVVYTLILFIFPTNTSGFDPPKCEWRLDGDFERLNCFVESGRNLILQEKIDGIRTEQVKYLTIECSDDHSGSDYSGFVLSPGIFMPVPNLRELTISDCEISEIKSDTFSSLRKLEKLTLRAHSSHLLVVNPSIFKPLSQLQHLDLSGTHLDWDSNEFLCFLPELTHLNLSRCGLRDFRFLRGSNPLDILNGDKSNCGSGILSLDLSWNSFSLVPPASFASLVNLVELRIDYSGIVMAAERALLGLRSLKIFSVSGNGLTSLPPEFFLDNRRLVEIYLQENSLAVLAPSVFHSLADVKVLDLSGNELSSEWVNGETFLGLEGLEVLDLARNNLVSIHSELFRDLSNLQLLSLENNFAEKIASIKHQMVPVVVKLIPSIKNGRTVCL